MLAILVGFVIGWITNYLAILMLFRPYKPTRILGLNVQGVFPRCQPEFAAAAGQLVAREFFGADVLRRHLAQPQTRAAIHDALRPLVAQVLDQPLGTPRQLAERLKWPVSVPLPMLAATLGDYLATTAVRDWQHPDTRRLITNLISSAINGVLRQPLGRWVAPTLSGGFPVSQWLQRLVESDLAAAITRQVATTINDRLRQANTLADLLPADAGTVMRSWIVAWMPAVRDLLARQVESGTLFQVVRREGLELVRQAVERRLPPDTWLGKMLSGDRVAGWVEGLTDKLPSVLAAALRSEVAGRAVAEWAQDLSSEVLRIPSFRVAEVLSAVLASDLRQWIAEGIQRAVSDPALAQRISDQLQEPLATWLNKPVGEGFFAAGINPDTLAQDAARLMVEAVEPAALAAPIRDVVQQRLTAQFDIDLGSVRGLLTALLGETTTLTLIETLTERVSDWAASHAADAVATLDVAGLVRENIVTWQPDKLEAAVQRVARTHLTFVTWIGGILGALIGALQWLLQPWLFG